MIKFYNHNLNKPDVILAHDCLLQLEQLGVLDKKSKKRIRSNIKNGYVVNAAHRAHDHVYEFINVIFSKKLSNKKTIKIKKKSNILTKQIKHWTDKIKIGK